MKRFNLLWMIVIMLFMICINQSGWGFDPDPAPWNAWTVFTDTFNDYTTTDPRHPFWDVSIGGSPPPFIYLDTEPNPYNISSCLRVVSIGLYENIIFHRNRLSNYSFQYFARIPSGGNWSESLFRYNLIPSGGSFLKYGYSLRIVESNKHLQLNKIDNGVFTILTEIDLTSINGLGNFDPHQIFDVKADISEWNFKIYVKGYLVLDYTDNSHFIETGGIGFRAWTSDAYYYYTRVDVIAQGQWKILYIVGKEGGVYAEYVDPDAADKVGTEIITPQEVSQLGSNYSLNYVIPTPFGEKLVCLLSTPEGSPTYESPAIALYNVENHSFRIIRESIYNQPDFWAHFQELNSVGIDGLAYISQPNSIGSLTLPDSGYGVYTPIESMSAQDQVGAHISPDGSFLDYNRVRKNLDGSYYLIPRVGFGLTQKVWDVWISDVRGYGDHSSAICPLTYVEQNYAGGFDIAGYEYSPQSWEMGMRGIWHEIYGPHDDAPYQISPTSLMYWNVRNGDHIHFHDLRDELSNQYPDYWAWPIRDPRWGTHPNRIIASYLNEDYDNGIYALTIDWSTKQAIVNSTPITSRYSENETNRYPFWAVWWNKPD